MLDRAAIVSTLQHACASRARCGLMLPGEPVHHAARFADIGAGMLLVDLLPGASNEAVRAAQVVCVTFSHARGSCCFMTRVLSRVACELVDGHERTGVRLRLAMPDSMSGIDGRLAFRVPVLDARLELDVGVDDGLRHRASVIDLCIGGAQIELPRALPELRVHQRIDVALRLRGTSFATVAEVRRRSDRRYGIFFAEVVREGKLSPPAGLARIVRELERRWLARCRIMAGH